MSGCSKVQPLRDAAAQHKFTLSNTRSSDLLSVGMISPTSVLINLNSENINIRELWR